MPQVKSTKVQVDSRSSERWAGRVPQALEDEVRLMSKCLFHAAIDTLSYGTCLSTRTCRAEVLEQAARARLQLNEPLVQPGNSIDAHWDSP